MRFAYLVLFWIAVLWSQSGAWAQTLSATAFRDLVIERIDASAPQLRVAKRDELGLEIAMPAGSEVASSSVNLDRAYQEYVADPTQLEAIIARWVRIITQAPEQPERARIVSVLRTQADVAAYETAMRRGPRYSPIVKRAFLGDLLEVMVFDSPDSVRFATEHDITDLGLALEEAWLLTDLNLPLRLGSLESYGVEDMSELSYLTGPNGLTPSMLTQPNVCERIPATAFIVLDRNTLVVGRVDNERSRRQFEEAVGLVQRTGQSLSLTPLVCSGDALAVYNLTDR
jgi:hypothetical protein